MDAQNEANEAEELFKEEQQKNRDIMERLTKEKLNIQDYQAELDEMEEEGQNNFDNVLAGDDDDGAVDVAANQQLVSKQYELKK